MCERERGGETEGWRMGDVKGESSPIPSHPAGQVITALLGLHKDDGLVLLLSHDLLHQLEQSGEGGREGRPRGRGETEGKRDEGGGEKVERT